MPSVLEFREVSYSVKAGREVIPVLASVSFAIDSPGVTALVGASGSGKSTVLDLAAGIISPTSGLISVMGEDLAGWGDAELASYRRRTVGYVFQDFRLVPTLTVQDNVALPMELAGMRRAQARDRASELLDRVGLKHRAGIKAGRLSGGEQQRAAVARAISLEPQLLLADEPTGSLDEHLRDEILDLLVSVAEGRNLIIVTHDAEVAGRADSVLRMDELNSGVAA